MYSQRAFRELGQDYPLTETTRNSPTKERILLEATILFAKNGYADVSVKDIADKVGIRPPSLYNHFSSKEDLWSAILHHIRSLYLLYFERLDTAWLSHTCFEDVLDSMFVELKEVVNIYTYYGFSLIQTEQFRDEQARDIYLNTFLAYSIRYIRSRFDECVRRGWAPAFDTEAMAAIFMHKVLCTVSLRVHEHLEHEIPCHIGRSLGHLQAFILKTVLGG